MPVSFRHDQTVVGSKRLLNNANWARYNLAVSLRKDTEPSSSSMWNMHLPGAPVVDFHKFFDGENLTQQDLVAWINVGMHHLVRCDLAGIDAYPYKFFAASIRGFAQY